MSVVQKLLTFPPGCAAAQVAVPVSPEAGKQTHEQNGDGGHYATADQNGIKHFSRPQHVAAPPTTSQVKRKLKLPALVNLAGMAGRGPRRECQSNGAFERSLA
jgi:hypothetical protein